MLKQMIHKFKKMPQPTLDEVLLKIEQADDVEISRIIQAIIHRYKAVYPDWEVLFLSLPLKSEERAVRLESIIQQLKKK